MIIDSGIRCPDIQAFNFFPFAPNSNYSSIYNQTGGNGPISGYEPNAIGVTNFSGMFGAGTFYPGSGNLDQLSRAFWCTRSWLLEVQLFRIANGGTTPCTSLDGGVSVDLGTYCTIGGFGGEIGSLNTAEIFLKTLTTQDFCSYTSTGDGKNVPGVCPPQGLPNADNAICVPTNPIQKFNDLLCRPYGFSWFPKQVDMGSLESGNYTGINSPYNYNFTNFFIVDPDFAADYDCNNESYFDTAYSLFSLSVMDPQILAWPDACLASSEDTYFPYSSGNAPFTPCGLSGETLTDAWGQVTGYGMNVKPSGVNTPIVFHMPTGIGHYVATGINDYLFFPFIYFQLKLKNSIPVSTLGMCPVNDYVSTLLTTNHQTNCGSFTIYDQVLSGNAGTSDMPFREIISVPLYGETIAEQLFVQVSLIPNSYWTTESGTPLY